MKLKELIWVSSSKKDLLKLPEDVIDFMGHGLYLAQVGEQHEDAKVLKGFGSADVIELIDTDSTGTYRAVYTIKMRDVVFVLHVFQKKSKSGIKTPQQDIDLIKNRIKQAQVLYNERNKNEKK